MRLRVAEGFSAASEGSPTSKPHGLEHVGVRGPGGDEMLLEQEARHLHDGTEGPLQDSLRPVTGQGAGCLDQFVPRCWGYFWAHFWLQWGRMCPSHSPIQGPRLLGPSPTPMMNTGRPDWGWQQRPVPARPRNPILFILCLSHGVGRKHSLYTWKPPARRPRWRQPSKHAPKTSSSYLGEKNAIRGCYLHSQSPLGQGQARAASIPRSFFVCHCSNI